MIASPRRAGFTIVEMLVVVGIIAVLAGLLLPALGGAQRRARKTKEVNNIRQVGYAWTLYASSNDDGALPGFLSTDAQADWGVRYKFADKVPIPSDDSEEWPWRLLSYLSFDPETILGYRGLSENDVFTSSLYSIIDEAYDATDPLYNDPTERPVTIAEQPAFGYNAYYVGGWWTLDPEIGRAVPKFDQATALPGGERVRVVVGSPSQIRKASLVLFCASTRAMSGRYQRVPDDRPGSHLVTPPTLAATPQWGLADLDQGQSVVATSETIIDVLTTTSIPVARYTGQVATLHADLHTEPHLPGAMLDMRMWIDGATKRDFVHAP